MRKINFFKAEEICVILEQQIMALETACDRLEQDYSPWVAVVDFDLDEFTSRLRNCLG